MGNQSNPQSRRRLAGIVGISAVLVTAAALSPVLSWHFGYIGLLLGLVAALVTMLPGSSPDDLTASSYDEE